MRYAEPNERIATKDTSIHIREIPPKQPGLYNRNKNSSSARKQSSHKPKNDTSINADWTSVFEKLRNAIQIRHYSPKTLKTYANYTRKFQAFLKSKKPRLVNVDDVKAFLTWMAVKKGVSASSRNLAFNSLLFLFRNVFHKEFGKIDGVVRAKRKPYIPVILSREEIDRILGHLSHPHHLIIQLMYGCGLRVTECISLRVQNFNFDGDTNGS